MHNFNEIPEQELKSESLGLQGVYEIIRNAPSFNQERQKAPFSDYKENTDLVWQSVSPEEVDTYLSSKLFFDTSVIPFESMKEMSNISGIQQAEAIKVPLDLVVCAVGFKDWNGRPEINNKEWRIRNGNKTLSGSMSSANVSKLYAGTPSELPAVSAMNMYIQPDGKVFFDNVGGDSHRISAAILRGDENVETRHLTVYKLEENYI